MDNPAHWDNLMFWSGECNGSFVGTVAFEISPCINYFGMDAARVNTNLETTSREIRRIGLPSLVAGRVLLHDIMQKSGRTTG